MIPVYSGMQSSASFVTFQFHMHRISLINPVLRKYQIFKISLFHKRSNQDYFSFQTATRISVEINQLLKVNAEFFNQRTRQKYNLNGSRPSHLLALQLCSNYILLTFPPLNDPLVSFLLTQNTLMKPLAPSTVLYVHLNLRKNVLLCLLFFHT